MHAALLGINAGPLAGGHQAEAAAAYLGDDLVAEGQVVAGGGLVVPPLIVPPASTASVAHTDLLRGFLPVLN